MLVRIEDVAFIAELRRRHAQHPAQLAAANDADRSAWADH
jgi:hypothetical protein